MFIDVHTEFILTPLFEILSDGVNACTPLQVGIENSAFGEYFMQSLFLRMTGAQEQKMKCICWVMATNDYRYRYDLLNVKQYGECSEYKHKKEIYKDLAEIIKGFDNAFIPYMILAKQKLPEERVKEIESSWKQRVDTKRLKDVNNTIAKGEKDATAKGKVLSQAAIDKIKSNILSKPYPQQDLESMLNNERKKEFVKEVVSRLITILDYSPLTTWAYRDYLFFKDHYLDVLDGKQLSLTSNELFANKLQKDYERSVFEHRNRTAHNTASYLKDVPTLDSLSDSGYIYKNYYFRFAILLLIDEIFVRMFKRYRELSIKRI